MCGRFTLTAEPGHVAEIFAAEISPALEGFRPRYNIAPTDEAPVVIAAPEGRRAGPMRWGLVPHWADSPRIGARMIQRPLRDGRDPERVPGVFLRAALSGACRRLL